jgi:ribosomal protein S12 methylthiotransferase accessory factor
MRPQPNSRHVAGNPETFGFNLTRRHFVVPAARVIAPGLQPMPSEIITPRLADMIARTGTTYTDGVALI